MAEEIPEEMQDLREFVSSLLPKKSAEEVGLCPELEALFNRVLEAAMDLYAVKIKYGIHPGFDSHTEAVDASLNYAERLMHQALDNHSPNFLFDYVAALSAQRIHESRSR